MNNRADVVSAAGTILSRQEAMAQGIAFLPVETQYEIDKEAEEAVKGALFGNRPQTIYGEVRGATDEPSFVREGREFIRHPSRDEEIDVTDFHEIRIGRHGGDGEVWCHLIDHKDAKMFGPEIKCNTIFEAQELKRRAERFFAPRREPGK